MPPTTVNLSVLFSASRPSSESENTNYGSSGMECMLRKTTLYLCVCLHVFSCGLIKVSLPCFVQHNLHLWAMTLTANFL